MQRKVARISGQGGGHALYAVPCAHRCHLRTQSRSADYAVVKFKSPSSSSPTRPHSEGTHPPSLLWCLTCFIRSAECFTLTRFHSPNASLRLSPAPCANILDRQLTASQSATPSEE